MSARRVRTSEAQRVNSAHRIEMQITAHFQQIFFGLNDRTRESTLKTDVRLPDAGD